MRRRGRWPLTAADVSPREGDLCECPLSGSESVGRDFRFGSTAGCPASDRLACNLPFALARPRADGRVHPDPATSGHPIGQGLASRTTGLNVPETCADVRLRRLDLETGRSRSRSRRQAPDARRTGASKSGELALPTRFGHSLYSKADSGGRTCWQKSPDAGQTVMRQYFPPLGHYWCICFSKRDCAVRSRL